MADAKLVLRETVEELNLLAGSGGTLEELQALSKLAHRSMTSKTGTVSNEDAQILHPSRWSRLGL
jgi:hypothetical protein